MADKTIYQFGLKDALPKSGQTTVYQAGDDGTYQAGNPRNPRFVDNGDGTVTDMATGLMWQKNPPDVGTNWSTAITNAEASTLAGYNDWRMPNVVEITSIVDHGLNWNVAGYCTYAVLGTFPDRYFWCSTTNAANSNHCFVLQKPGGVQSTTEIGIDKTFGGAGTCMVRGGI